MIIFKKHIQIHTKEIMKITEAFAIMLLIVFLIIVIKYKILFKVTINNKEIGYVTNKYEIEEEINNNIESQEEGVAFKNLEAKIEYKPEFVTNKKANKEEVLEKIEKNISTTYTAYGIMLDDDIKTYVATEEEADEIVKNIESNYKDKLVLNIGVKQIFDKSTISTLKESEALSKIKNENLEIKLSKIEEENKEKQNEEKNKQKEKTQTKENVKIANTTKEEKNNSKKTTNDTKANTNTTNKSATKEVVSTKVVAVRPVSSFTITSRFGERSSIRSSTHTGLDLAASTGTAIKSASTGTVIFAGYKGAYGNLIKIKCDNGYEMWYGHCSKIYVKEGQTVTAGNTIGAVGSTGNSTGPHLHFEVRKNGKALNPQKFL